MSQQRVSNERKKELDQLDPFQENLIKAISFAKMYKKQLGMIGAGIVLVIAVFLGIMYSFEKSENTASTLLSQALTNYSKSEGPEKGFESVKDDFDKIFKEYANTAAGKLAKIEYAKISFEASKFDESLKYYRSALDSFKNQSYMENFILMALGQVNLAKGDIESARSYFEKVNKGNTDILKDEALFSLAMIEEKQGNIDQSMVFYKKIISEYDNSIYLALAKSKVGE